MRQIGVLPRDLDPQLFGDHLLALGMKSRIVDGPSGWTVWIHNEDHLAKAKSELEAFLARPDDERFRQAARGAATVRREEARRDREFQRNFREVRDQWTGLQARRRPVTLLLVLAAVVVFLLQQTPRTRWIENRMFMATPRFSPERGWYDQGLKELREGQVWRLISPIFLHFGWPHILFNSWATIVEGTLIESRRGTARFAILVLVSAVLSNLGQFLYMDRAHPGAPHVFGGLSGVGYALFGYLWIKGRYEPEQGMILHPNTVMMMFAWLFLCMTGALGPIGNAAHVAGLLVGVAFGVLRF
ncbi:MAG: rhomboid family intramembrane serine protease [Isosphaeraceae bacterium]